MNAYNGKIKDGIDRSLLYRILEKRVNMVLNKAERRYHNTKSIQNMSEGELKPYRVIETNSDLYLIPKADKGVTLESKLKVAALGNEFTGAKVYTAICGTEVIVIEE